MIDDRAFSLPYRTPHFIVDGEILDGAPATSVDAIASYSPFPQVDYIHYNGDGEFVFSGTYIKPYSNILGNIRGYGINGDSDYYIHVGTLNRVALNLFYNDIKLRDSANQILFHIDNSLSSISSQTTAKGVIGLNVIKPNLSATPSTVGLNPSVYPWDITSGDTVVGNDVTYNISTFGVYVSEPVLSESVNTEINMDLGGNGFVSGRSYLIKIDADWGNAHRDVGSANASNAFVFSTFASISLSMFNNTLMTLNSVSAYGSHVYYYTTKYGTFNTKRLRDREGTGVPGNSVGSSSGWVIYRHTGARTGVANLKLSLSYSPLFSPSVLFGIKRIKITVEAL